MAKIRVTMKDPDCLHDALREAATERVERELPSLSEDARNAAAEVTFEEMNKACAKWFRCGEHLTVEIDTDAGTAVVVPQ